MFCFADGAIDLRAVRDSSDGKLTGIEVCAQEEFDARTAQMNSREEWPFTSEKSMIVLGEEGKIECVIS